MHLRYGLNPHQWPAFAEPVKPEQWPLTVVHGEPSYINLLDALSGWQLVRAAAAALGRPAAASFKHVSPSGAAVDGPLDRAMAPIHPAGDGSRAPEFEPGTRPEHSRPLPNELSAVARAYVRARDGDPAASYGDFVAVSDPVDASLAAILRKVVSDGVIAPAYEPGTPEILRAKKGGRFLVLQADPAFEPPAREAREVFGLRLVQPYVPPAGTEPFAGLPAAAADDLRLGMIVLAYTQSNAVAYLRDGMTVGIGAGQQSRIDCTRIAGTKADRWFDRRNAEPHGVSYVSDGMIPFRDNIDEAARHGVRWVAEPGGSIRTEEVRQACTEHGIVHIPSGRRLFHH